MKQERSPEETTAEKRSPARLHEYWLGGDHHSEDEHQLSGQISSFHPDVHQTARAHSAFVRRAVAFLQAQAGLLADRPAGVQRAGIHPLAGRIGQVGVCRGNAVAPAPDDAEATSFARCPAGGGIRRRTLLRAIRHECARQRP